MYQAGEYVYPTNLPRRVLCRVAAAETRRLQSSAFQILELEPLGGGPWDPDTRLVRLDEEVTRVAPRNLWRSAVANDGGPERVSGDAPHGSAWAVV